MGNARGAPAEDAAIYHVCPRCRRPVTSSPRCCADPTGGFRSQGPVVEQPTPRGRLSAWPGTCERFCQTEGTDPSADCARIWPARPPLRTRWSPAGGVVPRSRHVLDTPLDLVPIGSGAGARLWSRRLAPHLCTGG